MADIQLAVDVWWITASLKMRPFTEPVGTKRIEKRGNRMRQPFPHLFPILVTLISLAFSIGANAAEGKGDGACVITPNAPVYLGSKGDKVIGTLEVGDCVVGATGTLSSEFIFKERDGRKSMEFLPKKDAGGLAKRGWMKSEDLATFTFDCSCGAYNGQSRSTCTPYSIAGSGFMAFVYNSCYKDARDKKKAELLKENETASASTKATQPASSKYEKIAELKKLLDAGALTQKEFDSEKSKVLAAP